MRLVCFLVLSLHVVGAWAQQKYWVYVNSEYPDGKRLVKEALTDYGKVGYYSTWLNAFSATLENVDRLPYHLIDSIRPVALMERAEARRFPKARLGFALEQINATAIMDAGLTGKDVKIGIIDGGFLEAPQDPLLEPFFANDQVKAYRDFVTPDLKPYGGSAHHGDDHGNLVWQHIAGTNLETEVQFGLASNAQFYLARTDDGRTDFRAEEDHMVAALEWLDSLDVKLVNISVGYSIGFEDPRENYRPEHMDGQTVALTKAAQIASKEKGMLLVVAGGNDGNNSFKVISTPADAKDALTVGATAFKHWQKVSYSSVGAEFLPFIKPDVSCFSTQGTSFAAPIITGLAACLWEAYPHLTNLEIKDLIVRSSHLYEVPNNYLGYGVPDVRKILTDPSTTSTNTKTRSAGKKVTRLQLPEDTKSVLMFHKSDSVHVTKQEIVRSPASKLKIRKVPDVTHSTVVVADEVTEIVWHKPK